MHEAMPGASDQTRRVKALNANWTAGADADDDGQFALMIVTEDDQQHFVSLSPAAAATVLAFAQADTVLLWDPTDRTLIVGNIIGEWLPRA
jgi:hypothetical protein